MPITNEELRQRFVSPAMQHYFRRKLPALTETELSVRIEEALKFLLISPDCTGPIPVSKEIDEIWHVWILETKEYASLCRSIGDGEFIHHTSNDYLAYYDQDARSDEDLLLGVRMLATYTANYGAFEELRVKYWLLASWLCNKQGWSICELNEWLRSIGSRIEYTLGLPARIDAVA